MLARALVAERLVGAELPSLDLTEVYDKWEDHRRAIARAVAEAVHLGVDEARPVAMMYFDAVIADPRIGTEDRVQLARTVGAIDAQAAQYVLDALRPGFDQTIAQGGLDVAWRLENYVSLAGDLARWSLTDAITMLLDAAGLDHRATNPNPGHPVRQIQEFMSAYHPELPADDGAPAFLAKAAAVWLDDHADEPRAWDVYGEVASAALALTRTGGAFSDPGNPLTFTFYTRAATASQITDIANRVWPSIVRGLRNAPARTIAHIVEAVEHWLHLGAGNHSPFGGQPPADVIAAANEAAKRLFADLAPIVSSHPGLAARYNRVGEQYGLNDRVQIADDLAPVFQEIEVRPDWERDIDGYRQAILPVVRQWTSDPPDDVCRRIVELRGEFTVAGLAWPPRATILSDQLIAEVKDTQPWIDAALAARLFPDAEPMVRRHKQLGRRLPIDQIIAAMSEPAARSAFAGVILSDASAQPDELSAVIQQLGERDLRLFVNLGYAKLADERWQILLTQTERPALLLRLPMLTELRSTLNGAPVPSPGNGSMRQAAFRT